VVDVTTMIMDVDVCQCHLNHHAVITSLKNDFTNGRR